MTGVRGWLAALSVVLAVASCGAVGTVAPQGIPIPSADFVAGTVGNVTYILLPTQSYQYEPASGAWKSVLEVSPMCPVVSSPPVLKYIHAMLWSCLAGHQCQ